MVPYSTIILLEDYAAFLKEEPQPALDCIKIKIKKLRSESTTDSKNNSLPKYLTYLCKINYRRSLKLTLYIVSHSNGPSRLIKGTILWPIMGKNWKHTPLFQRHVLPIFSHNRKHMPLFQRHEEKQINFFSF